MSIVKSDSAIVQRLSLRYPQLLLPIEPGMSGTERYRAAALRGKILDADPNSFGSAFDSYETVQTIAGSVGVWQLGERADFVRAVQALVYRCEPVPVPEAVGAQYIGGLANWEKIRAHRAQFFAGGGRDWGAELHRFTADKANYTDSLILLSSGFYSNVPPQELSLPEQQWREASCRIRKYHELTHFIYRKAYPGDVDVVRDEVLADCMGLLAAFGSYSPALARRFLGIREGTLLPDARLRHYLAAQALDSGIRRACFWIDSLEKILLAAGKEAKINFLVTQDDLACIQ